MIAALLLPLVWLAGEIIGMQRQLAEVGRLRLGIKGPNGEPRKLKTLRFTSRHRAFVEAAAAVYRGEVKEWRNADVDEFEVVTETAEVPIILPPDSSSQHYEHWGSKRGSHGYCLQRCDGRWDSVRRVACDCDPENRKCKAVTRLSVIIPTIRGLGRWRLDSHGWWAGVEIPGAVQLIEAVAATGSMVRARLRLESRRRRKLINGKPATLDFVVPVIDLDISVEELEAQGGLALGQGPAVADGGRGLPAGQQGAGDPRAPTGELELPESWKPIEADQPPPAPLDEQLAIPGPPTKRRANAATPIPPTGATVGGGLAERVCSNCGQPYGTGEVVRNPNPGGSRFVHKSCPGPGPASETPGTGTASGIGGNDPAAATVEPTPAPTEEPPAAPARRATKKKARAPRDMTYGQQGKLYALVNEVWPRPDMPDADPDTQRMAREENDEIQREGLLALAQALGGGQLESRTEIDGELAGHVIDALDRIVAGELALVDGALIDTRTGETDQ